ncbi:MAG: phosphatase PAP2 family protein [Gemmatimonadetes bacterium]|nr:phosphatase PAP2 family protein [Gemmatimonadota bacterium]
MPPRRLLHPRARAAYLLAATLALGAGPAAAQRPPADTATAGVARADTAAARLAAAEAGPARFAPGRDVSLGFAATAHALTAPARWGAREWLAIPTATAGLAALSLADARVDHFVDRDRRGFKNTLLNTIEPLGAEASIPIVVATYVAGIALDRPGLRRTGVEAAASSVAAAGVITPLLKKAVGRARPRQHLGSHHFDPFGGDVSFPSGHTTQAFAIASVFAAEAHPLWARIAAYGLASGVGVARMYHGAHFASDVAGGALIGTLVGRGVVRFGRSRVRVAPAAGGAGVAIAF